VSVLFVKVWGVVNSIPSGGDISSIYRYLIKFVRLDFIPKIPVSSNNKAQCHDINDIVNCIKPLSMFVIVEV